MPIVYSIIHNKTKIVIQTSANAIQKVKSNLNNQRIININSPKQQERHQCAN